MTTSAERTLQLGACNSAITHLRAARITFLVPLGHWMSMDLHAGDRVRITQNLTVLAVLLCIKVKAVNATKANRSVLRLHNRLSNITSTSFSRRNTQRVRVEDRCAFVYAR